MEELQAALGIAIASGDLNEETVGAMMIHAKRAQEQIVILRTLNEVIDEV